MNGKVIHLRAATDGEALAKVYADYGAEAIIGEISQVRKLGIAGLFGAKEIEVSVRIKPPKPRPEDDIEKFRSMVNRIGHSIRSDQTAGYFKHWEVALKEFDIQGDLAGKILTLGKDTPFDRKSFATAIAKAVPISNSISRITAFVGSTGSGKTTTIAKLAGLNGCQRGKRVAIISVDTYRIGAVEQLRTYTRIMGIPLSIVSSPGEFREAIEKYDKYDCVYIDTTGRPPGNRLSIAELESFLVESPGIEVALVVNATTKVDDLMLASKSFSRLQPSSLIVTRVDETASMGSIVSFIHQVGIPLACIGTGQSVPQDIKFADAITVADWILSGTTPFNGRLGGINVG